MRILHNADLAGLGGIQRHVVTLALAQREYGHQPIVATAAEGYLTKSCERHGIPVIIEPHLYPHGEEWKFPKEWIFPVAESVGLLARRFEELDVDVVHSHTVSAAAQAIPAGNAAGKACVFTHHAIAPLLLLPVHQALGVRSEIVSVSRAGLDSLRRNGASADRLHYVPNGTPAAPRGSRAGAGRRRLMLVARLSWEKGIDTAILAMAELHARHGTSCPELNVYGDGSLAEYLKTVTHALGLGEVVHFHGTRVDVIQDGAEGDVLVVPSRSEACPLVVLEAMSRGIPVVATAVGGVPDMIPDARYGRLVPADSAIALADAVDAVIADLAEGKVDPEAVAAHHSAFFSEAKMVERLNKVYADASG
ncbi:glycosyltransferase family 4 protein [Streptomyces sp. BE147]|uniref:glycosyltransferase family 4 protein n=1 Tax=Streptomyces sp. BE147 TaxID=3002524 RepID=UPI002E75C2CE|nr:glycosyltransferase family 4 protein [Streptomyces sp. BE147]MEE1736687.1 glycosyltransferase family 4 protein [Streptomyces sp. BE147]